MGNTTSMRQFVNLLRYDKPSNSLPIFLSIFLTIIGFVTVITAALNEKDVDTSLEAIKDIVSVSIGSFVCIIEQSLYPERTLNLIQVIEDDFVVDREELRERGDGLWTEIGELYQRKREDMREKFQYLYWALVFIFCGYFSKHFLNRVLGIEVQSKERWPTPFLYPLPLSPSSSYLFYTYTLHVIILASACVEGCIMVTTVTVTTEKIMADFETLYLLLDYMSNDFSDSNIGNVRNYSLNSSCQNVSSSFPEPSRKNGWKYSSNSRSKSVNNDFSDSNIGNVRNYSSNSSCQNVSNGFPESRNENVREYSSNSISKSFNNDFSDLRNKNVNNDFPEPSSKNVRNDFPHSKNKNVGSNFSASRSKNTINDFWNSSSENEKENRRLMYEERDSTRSRSGGDLRGDMRRIVRCHQMINRNLKICTDCSAFAITGALAVIINDSCSNAFFMLKNNNLKKTVSYAFIFIVENLLLLFLCQNGQRIFNQNDVLRRYLAELPWTDKPQWFRQTVHMMMTRANFDTEMRPYGIFVLNYVSFKDIMKFTFSVGNVLYTKKLRSQSQL